MKHDLDAITNEIEQGFMQAGGWKACRYLLGKLVPDGDAAPDDVPAVTAAEPPPGTVAGDTPTPRGSEED